MHRPSLAALLLSLAHLPAQTFTVDAQNRPGTDFLDLPTAVAVAPDGATLLVRPGSYGPIRMQGKGLTIVGGPGVQLNAIDGPVIDVANLGPNQSFSLRAAVIGWCTNGDQATFANCAGPVLLHGLFFDYVTAPRLVSTPLPTGLAFQNCRQVTVRDSEVRATNAVRAVNSALVCENCELVGSGSTAIVVHNPAFAGSPALLLAGSSCQVANCTLVGGPGPHLQLPPAAAVALSASTLHLGGTTVAAAGQPSGFPMALPAIDGNGTVVRDPVATLQPLGAAPAVAPSITESVQPWPALQVRIGVLGTPLVASLHGAHGELALMCFSLPAAPLALPGIAGDCWLDLNWLSLLGAGALGPAGPLTVSVQTPATPVLVGLRTAWQAMSWGAAGPQLSNASTYVYRL